MDLDELRILIKDSAEVQDIIEFLDPTVDETIDAFKDQLLDRLEEVLDWLGYDREDVEVD